jgi:hypothetical protein
MTNPSKVLATPLLALLALAGTAQAHHSTAMFEDQKLGTVSGIVKEFQYTQPHCWLVVTVAGENGAAAQEWRFETGAPTLLQSVGILKSTFPAGEAVTVNFRPLRDGRPAGLFLSAKLASGKEVGLAPPGPPPKP